MIDDSPRAGWFAQRTNGFLLIGVGVGGLSAPVVFTMLSSVNPVLRDLYLPRAAILGVLGIVAVVAGLRGARKPGPLNKVAAVIHLVVGAAIGAVVSQGVIMAASFPG